MMMPIGENESISHVFLTFLQWGVEEKLDTVCVVGDDEGLDLFENGLGNGENGVYHIDYAVANNYGLLEAMSLLALHLYNAGELEEGTELSLTPIVLDRDNPETIKQASSEPNPAWIDYIEENFPSFFESIITLES